MSINQCASLIYGVYDDAGNLVGSNRAYHACVYDWSILASLPVPVVVLHGGIDCADSLRSLVDIAGRVMRASNYDVSLTAVYVDGLCVGAWVHRLTDTGDLTGGVEYMPFSDAFRRVVHMYGLGVSI